MAELKRCCPDMPLRKDCTTWIRDDLGNYICPDCGHVWDLKTLEEREYPKMPVAEVTTVGKLIEELSKYPPEAELGSSLNNYYGCKITLWDDLGRPYLDAACDDDCYVQGS